MSDPSPVRPPLQRESYRKILETEPNRFSDVSRLARLLTGTSVGVVLGGGGARGAAHIGMLKAIQVNRQHGSLGDGGSWVVVGDW